MLICQLLLPVEKQLIDATIASSDAIAFPGNTNNHATVWATSQLLLRPSSSSPFPCG
jgi:hypothetical protein